MTPNAGDQPYHLRTYTYRDLNGNGVADITSTNVANNNRQTSWHYVYTGYSKALKKLAFYIKWRTSDNKVVMEQVNHYYSEKFYLLLARHFKYPFLNGQLAYLNVNFGKGAYNDKWDYKHP